MEFIQLYSDVDNDIDIDEDIDDEQVSMSKDDYTFIHLLMTQNRQTVTM